MKGGIPGKVLSVLASALIIAVCWFGVWRLMDKAVEPGTAPSGTVSTDPTQTQTPGEPGGSGSTDQQPGESSPGTVSDFVPTEADVLALRDRVTEGMTDGEKAALRDAVVNANLALEHRYFYDSFFERLRDPESLYWNYFEETGEIQIGWAESSDGTRTKVMDTNNFAVEDYVRRLQSLKETVVSGLLDEDFDRLTELLTTAKRDHDGAAVLEFYHMFHDLDYFLMRFGETDVGPYVVDRSTVTLYYGALAVWKNEENQANKAY